MSDNKYAPHASPETPESASDELNRLINEEFSKDKRFLALRTGSPAASRIAFGALTLVGMVFLMWINLGGDATKSTAHQQKRNVQSLTLSERPLEGRSFETPSIEKRQLLPPQRKSQRESEQDSLRGLLQGQTGRGDNGASSLQQLERKELVYPEQ